MTASTIVERIAGVRARIAAACERAGRDPSSVTLIGVSKTHPAEAVQAALDAGLRNFGENRVQEGTAKIPLVHGAPTWHLIGNLQTNKVRAAISAFAILHAVDSLRLAEAIDRCAASPVRCLVEVNVSGESTKSGVSPYQLPSLLEAMDRLPNVAVEGLMTVAPYVTDADEVRPVFRSLAELAREHALTQLSMGMTNDFEVAIEEGATMVRVGRAIFGDRNV